MDWGKSHTTLNMEKSTKAIEISVLAIITVPYINDIHIWVQSDPKDRFIVVLL